jgi:predicted ester cyclase
MPGSYAVSLDRYIGRPTIGGGYVEGERRIPVDFGPSMPMRGFEETYRNIVDYIVRITHRIWEDREVEYIAKTYADGSFVYDDYGLQRGSAKIIADTHHTTGAFSNIRLIADEIVWAGDDEAGYHTSHRTLIRGTNDGDSRYGPATGKDVDVLVIANCVSKENVIFLEHVLYNNSSLLLQLGHDLDEVVAGLCAAPPAGWPRNAETWDALRAAARPGLPICEGEPVSGFDVDAFARDTLNAVWNEGENEVFRRNFASDFSFQGPTGRAFEGAGPYRDMVAGIRNAFPDLVMQVDEVYWMGNGEQGYLTSERWSAEGTHLGQGAYGLPTGQRVQIWGITQHRIVDGKIVGEWMLFNELDLLMQIHSARQAQGRSVT